MLPDKGILSLVQLKLACMASELIQKLNMGKNCNAKDSPDNNIIVINF